MGLTHPYKIFHDKTIGVAGEVSEEVPCTGYGKITVYLYSTKAGVLEVQIDPSGESSFYYFEQGFYPLELTTTEKTVDPNKIKVHPLDLQVKFVKIKFTPTETAVVNGWVNRYAEGSD